MILSLSHNFIFVHIPKTAGSSIMNILKPYDRKYRKSLIRSLSRKLSFVEPADSAHFRVHDTASKIISKLSYPVWNNYFSFSVVRNPFDHAVSHYEYMKQFRSRAIAKEHQRMTFETYLNDRQKKPFHKRTTFVRMPDQAYYLLSKDGKIAVNKVIKFENLVKEWELLSQQIGIADIKLPHVNKTIAKRGNTHFSEYYTSETEEIVRKIYQRDFELFGYSDRL